MTREEAREHIKDRMELYIHSTLDNFALHKALEALEQPEIVHCKDCKFNQNEDGTTDCDFHNFWCAYDDGYCNFGKRKEEE